MLRATWTPGRRGALAGASAAVACLGGVLAGCGGGGSAGGYVAVGAPGEPPRTSGTAGAPTGSVTLVPLDGRAGRAESEADADRSPSVSAPNSAAATAGSGADRSTPAGPSSPGSVPSFSPDGADPPRTPGNSPVPAPGLPSPAALTWSEPERADAGKRWCEKVTLEFHNSGGSPVRSGTVTFGTHIIGALGTDWGTVESVAELPVPVGAGARKEKTWTVCVDAWRVPLGMHVETRDVSVRWK